MNRVHGGDAVFSPRLAGFVLDAFSGDTRPNRSRPRPAHHPRAGSPPPHRARLHLPRNRNPTTPLRQDHREPRLLRAPQTATLRPPPTHRLGQRTTHRVAATAHVIVVARTGQHRRNKEAAGGEGPAGSRSAFPRPWDRSIAAHNHRSITRSNEISAAPHRGPTVAQHFHRHIRRSRVLRSSSNQRSEAGDPPYSSLELTGLCNIIRTPDSRKPR